MGSEFISSGTLKPIQIYMPCSLHRVHRVAVGWCLGGRMYYPKADYLEEVKAITSYIKKLRNRKI